MRILALDAGSSSLKYAVVDVTSNVASEIVSGEVSHVASTDASNRGAAIQEALAELSQRSLVPEGIGHRVVFGGPNHIRHERLTDAVIADLRNETQADPLHLPMALDAIDAARAAYPNVGQVACYDTAFFADLPELAKRFPLPRNLYPAIHRYGFHGLSYEYVLSKLGDRATGRVVIAHLGNGASMTAVLNRRPIDTTMGLTPLGGIMMGTRPGDLDPGILLRLFRDGRTIDEVADIVTNKSGLLGVSGTTADVRELVKRSSMDAAAAEALALFAYCARKGIGSLTAALSGIDRLVFTGGIGEHDARMRAAICGGLEYLGIGLAGGAAVPVDVIPTDESATVARHTATILT